MNYNIIYSMDSIITITIYYPLDTIHIYNIIHWMESTIYKIL